MSRVVKQTVVFDVEVEVEEYDGRWAGTTKPFAMTVYGDTPDATRERAVEAVKFLLGTVVGLGSKLPDYLTLRGVKHVVHEEDADNVTHEYVTRSVHQVMVTAGG